MRKTEGITLVALVVTIVVMLILAAISINIAFGDDGIFGTAKQAGYKQKVETFKERITTEMTKLFAESAVTGQPLTGEKIVDHFEDLDWIGNASKESDDTVRLISTDKIIVDVKFTPFNGFEFIEQGEDDGEPYPTIEVEQLPLEGTAGETIKIKVTASVEIKKNTKGIDYVENVTTGEKKNYEEGGVIFEVTENREYTFKAVTNKGKSKIAKITINIAQAGVIEISATPVTPRNTLEEGTKNGVGTGPINVTISYGEIELNNSNKYQYMIGTGGNWEVAESENITIKVNKNTEIYARYYDGTNSLGVKNYSIQNVDNVNPSNVTARVSQKTTNSLTIDANADDEASSGAGADISGILRYEYSMNGTNWQTSNIISNLNHNTEYTIYVKAIDKAGNEMISQVTEKTEMENTAPTFAKQAYASNRGTTSITISATATDVDGDTLDYTLYWGTSTSNLSKESTTSGSSGSAITFSKSNLESYKTYYFRVDVSDGEDNTTGTRTFAKTYCPTTKCTGPFTEEITCTSCVGTGKLKHSIRISQFHNGEQIGTMPLNCDKCGLGKWLYYDFQAFCDSCNTSTNRFQWCTNCRSG